MTENLRVLIVSSMYPCVESPIGGIFVHEQVKALRAQGIDARVVSGKAFWLSGRRPALALYNYLRSRRRSWPGWTSYDGVPVCYFPFPAGCFSRKSVYSYFYSMALAQWLPELRRSFDYQLVHAHTAYLDGRAGAYAARAARAPYVLTEHTGPLTTVTTDWTMRRQTQFGIDAADTVIAVSNALRGDLLSQLSIPNPAKVIVVSNGVDTAFFSPASASEINSPLDGVLRAVEADTTLDPRQYLTAFLGKLNQRHGVSITTDLLLEIHGDIFGASESDNACNGTGAEINAIWVGHHVDVKRVDRLLHAFAIAQRHEPRLRLTLIGDGPLEGQNKAVAKQLSILPYVRFLSGMSRERVREYIARSDFLVVSSETETFGVVAIEAMSMGLPVLATACGGPADTISNANLGELVGNTCEDLAIGFQRISKRLSQFNREIIRSQAIQRFDYARIADQLLGCYRRLLLEPRK